MIKLGAKVKDSITGFSGIAVSRTVFLYGCVRIGVESKKIVDGKIVTHYFDEQRLEKKSTVKTGGPGDPAPRKRCAER